MKQWTVSVLCLGVVITAAQPAWADADTLEVGQCLDLNKAVADLQLAMVGMSSEGAGQARQNLDDMRGDLPSSIDADIEALLEVSRKADEMAVPDSDHPMANGEFQKADAAYSASFQELCPDY